ncbi:MAG: hypothetical protein NVSMB56_13000 [Pyrinomonadaceae bacterium]
MKLKAKLYLILLCAPVVSCLHPVRLCAQQPTPTPTGRPYSNGEPAKRPSSPAAPQEKSPVTFKDITASSGVTFQHQASPTSHKYLPESMGAGVAVFDFDNDGRTDIVIAVTNGAPVILQNNGTKNHWLGIKLVGTKSNRNGIGARVVVTDGAGHKQYFDTNNAGSYLSSNDPRIRVGLGATTSVQSIEIRWTSGIVQKIENPAIDRYMTITEK